MHHLRTHTIRGATYLRLHRATRSFNTMALTRSTQPLVWIDCEMTGLEPPIDRILSLSCFVTTHDLQLLDDSGYHAVIKTPRVVLNSMSKWCRDTHGQSGLTQECLASNLEAEQAAEELLKYIKRYVPKQSTALLAGNSVHADKTFLIQKPWTPVVEWLHYRLFDISAIKEAARRWCSDDVLARAPVKQLTHTAEQDIKESLDEARFYMDLFKRMDFNSTTK